MKFVILPAARSDILRQFDWYTERGGLGLAERFFNSVHGSVDVILDQPYVGAPRFFANPRLAGLRSWPVKDFEVLRIFYLVDDETVTVIRILHGHRDLDAILGD